MNAERFIIFLNQMLKNSPQKVFLRLDNLRVHHSNIIKDWVKENKENIKLFFAGLFSREKILMNT